MVDPASSNPVVGVRIEQVGDQHDIYMLRADGVLEVTRGATIAGGLRFPGDVLVHLLANGVPIEEAEHCIEEMEPGFDARAEDAPMEVKSGTKIF